MELFSGVISIIGITILLLLLWDTDDEERRYIGYLFRISIQRRKKQLTFSSFYFVLWKLKSWPLDARMSTISVSREHVQHDCCLFRLNDAWMIKHYYILEPLVPRKSGGAIPCWLSESQVVAHPLDSSPQVPLCHWGFGKRAPLSRGTDMNEASAIRR